MRQADKYNASRDPTLIFFPLPELAESDESDDAEYGQMLRWSAAQRRLQSGRRMPVSLTILQALLLGIANGGFDLVAPASFSRTLYSCAQTCSTRAQRASRRPSDT